MLIGVADDDCYRSEATTWLANLLSNGRTIYLEADPLEPITSEPALWYVWIVGDDGRVRLVNETMVRGGYGRLLPSTDELHYGERLRNAEAVARADERGLWGCTLE